MKNFQDISKIMASLRRDYAFGKLEDGALSKDPFTQFSHWLGDAVRKKTPHLDAMTLATAAKNGKPSARVLLLKGFDRRGFVFYTHYESHKGRDLQKNPRAEIVFFWGPFERQVRVAGRIAKLPAKESDRYFRSRPRESQIGAWASHQSAPVKSRAALEQACRKTAQKFEGKKIPRPPFWGGYLLKPESFEFWQGRASRLNDRFLYSRKGSRWNLVRLQP
jgi:pyridoxamine 5'-phosphate oxidase